MMHGYPSWVSLPQGSVAILKVPIRLRAGTPVGDLEPYRGAFGRPPRDRPRHRRLPPTSTPAIERGIFP